MLSEAAKRELLEAAASPALREDFEKMAENVKRADREMGLDALLSFLTAVSRMFKSQRRPPGHEPYTRALL